MQLRMNRRLISIFFLHHRVILCSMYEYVACFTWLSKLLRIYHLLLSNKISTRYERASWGTVLFWMPLRTLFQSVWNDFWPQVWMNVLQFNFDKCAILYYLNFRDRFECRDSNCYYYVNEERRPHFERRIIFDDVANQCQPNKYRHFIVFSSFFNTSIKDTRYLICFIFTCLTTLFNPLNQVHI